MPRLTLERFPVGRLDTFFQCLAWCLNQYDWATLFSFSSNISMLTHIHQLDDHMTDFRVEIMNENTDLDFVYFVISNRHVLANVVEFGLVFFFFFKFFYFYPPPPLIAISLFYPP